MSHLLDDDDDLHGRKHRELTLSTGTVLGIFLGLALSWALFFGFGYKMGNKARQTVQTAAAAGTSTNADGSSTDFSTFKPNPGSPSGSYGTTASPNGTNPASATNVPPAAIPAAPPPAPAATEKPAPITLPAPASAPAATSPAQPVTSGNYVVQIAAVSHKEDAGFLVNALRAKGYAVTAQPGSDNLIHVQVGPFSSHKQAESMRQQLLSDGYNAIIK